MKIRAIKTRIFQENENLFDFVVRYIPKVREGDIVVVTSKIVALSEGRTAIVKNEKEKDALIKKESDLAIKTKYVWLTVKDGMVCANAGVDESNADGKIVLLPKDSYKFADKFRKQLMKHYGVKKLGVLLTDSRLMPLRAGVIGVAVGYAGFKGVRDYRNTPDIFGRKLKFTQTDVADSLATAVALVMGEGKECQPIAVVEEAPVEFTEKINKKELIIPIAEDLYAPMFKRLGKK
ncbi:MAG: coenzyme F420-0:L-glutamate ligase [Candidatus Pacebacteria bacterium]|nr:coenzyme F420-0:L-glutamate ligase [Candidatus Paceibacterota bacterium]